MGKSSRSGRRTFGPRRLSARAPASRWLREFTASYSIQLRMSPRCSRPVTEIRTRRWGSATGRSRSAKASRTLKAAVLKPIAKAREATANAVTPGFRANARMAARNSRRKLSILELYVAAAKRMRNYRWRPGEGAWPLVGQLGKLRADWKSAQGQATLAWQAQACPTCLEMAKLQRADWKSAHAAIANRRAGCHPAPQRAGTALPHVGFQDLLAQADAGGRHFHELVVADEFDGLFQIEKPWRHQSDAFVGGGSAHVGELLLLDDVDVEIGIAGVFADNLAAVHLGAGSDEYLAAFLEVEDGIAGGSSRTVGHQRSGGPRGNFALPLDVAVEERVHDGGAARVGEDFAAQADQAAGGHMEFQAHAAGAVVDHLDHLPLACAELLDDHAQEIFRAIDDQVFHRLAQFVVDGARQDLGLAHRQFVAFAAHHFNQDGELQFAAAHHLEGVVAQLLDADGNVGQQFLVESLAQGARRHPLALAPGKGRGVDGERHGDGGLVDLDGRQRLRIFRAGDGLPDGDAFHAGDGQNVALPPDGFIDALEPLERIQLGDLGGVHCAVALGDGHVVAVLEGAVDHAADAQAAEIIAVIQVGNQHLQDAIRVAHGRRNVLHDGVEQRPQIGGRIFHLALGEAGLGDGVEHRKIELIFRGVEVDEEIVDLVEDFLDAGIRPVDFVDDDDGRELIFQGLAENVAGLRQGPFARVHQQHDAVDNLERALHFSAEIAVAGGVDDVDLHAVVTHAGDLGEDGDASLALQVVGIHHAVYVLLMGAEDSALIEHGVHESGLAMIYVRDDGDIANVRVAACHVDRYSGLKA